MHHLAPRASFFMSYVTLYRKYFKRTPKLHVDAGDPEPVVLLRGFGESALKFELRAFITEKFSLNVQSELNFEVLKVFEKHNIEIPYPKRDLNLKIDSKDPNQSKIFGKRDK